MIYFFVTAYFTKAQKETTVYKANAPLQLKMNPFYWACRNFLTKLTINQQEKQANSLERKQSCCTVFLQGFFLLKWKACLYCTALQTNRAAALLSLQHFGSTLPDHCFTSQTQRGHQPCATAQ